MKLPWNRKNRPKREPPKSPPVELLTTAAMGWLLTALALAVAPQTSELPMWLTVLFAALVGWRGFLLFRDQ
ncbi:MAG TPA: hypothetical protein P5326_12345, partial [Candidatus Contendobacter sp.]|nr:hypothetical protein [Candidatus Contendobacter sp.]